MNGKNTHTNRKLPPFASTWVRYMLAFSVSVGVGLAPYLGRVGVPLFTPLLTLIPLALQDIAVPISAACMGLIAVLVQWKKNGEARNREFGVTLGAATVALLVFVTIEMAGVAHIEVPAADARVSFAIGFSVPNSPPCVGLSREACITKRLGLDESSIDSYFGETQVNLTKLALVLAYVSFTSLFGLAVGLLVVKDTRTRVRKTRQPR